MFEFIDKYINFILIGAILFFIIWLIFIEVRLRKANIRISKFFKGKKADDLEEVIFEILKREKNNEKAIKEIYEKIQNIDSRLLNSIQKVGILRYNPYKEIGGNQSFSIALLDEKQNGFILTSYHQRGGTRVYLKPIEGGRSEFTLTEEEKEVINKAINKEIKNKK